MARRSADFALQPTHRESGASEIEVDDSQQVAALHWILQTPKATKKDLQSFDIIIASDRRELETLLAQRKRQAEEATMRHRNELAKAVLSALQTPNRPPQGTPATLDDTKIASNGVFRSFAHILTASKHLLGEYDRLDKMIRSMQDAEPEGVAEAWTEEVEKTAKLLRVGAKIAIKNVKKVLGADVEVSDVDTDREENEKMSAVETMELNCELKRSLYFAESGVKTMAQSLPQGE
ncbi:hypothetical protein SVAN01_09891 [Stagonosporopsis vannaccii]|nr:hypothetical protein SVAN01_09891 [Stagonosporopsis vannaccii]